MAITLYGIPNCDQVKKARTWLNAQDISYDFHDFKKAGISRELIQPWLKDVAWDVLLNRKGTTWRGLTEERKALIVDETNAIMLMLESPSIIKRPVLAANSRAYVGFSAELYQQIFKNMP